MKLGEIPSALGRIAAGTILVSSLNGCGSDILPPGQTDITINNAPENFVQTRVSPDFNASYLPRLFNILQQERGTRDSRIQAIKNNISIVLGNEGNRGTALLIDDNGTYLTVAHLLTVNAKNERLVSSKTEVVHLKTGNTSIIQHAYYGLDKDIAIVDAPSGNGTRPVDDIMISTVIPQPGEQVWAIGIVLDPQTQHFNLRIIQETVVAHPTGLPNLADQVYTKGNETITGMSGGVVVDHEGKIVGLIKSTLAEYNNGITSNPLNGFIPIRNYTTLFNGETPHSLPTS